MLKFKHMLAIWWFLAVNVVFYLGVAARELKIDLVHWVRAALGG